MMNKDMCVWVRLLQSKHLHVVVRKQIPVSPRSYRLMYYYYATTASYKACGASTQCYLQGKPCLPLHCRVMPAAQALSPSAAVPSCKRISLKTLNCVNQPLLIKTRAIPGAFLWLLSPSHTLPSVENPMASIARDLASVHSANRWAAVWSPWPHGQAGDAVPRTPRRSKKARKPIFSVRALHNAAPSAFANDSYRRRCLPWKAWCIRILQTYVISR